jgi:hypothetical protein
MILDISDVLARSLANHAQQRGMDIEDFLQALLEHERIVADRQAIEQEQAWWMSRPLGERAMYEGKFVAVFQQQLVDSDPDDQVLFRRIRNRFGQAPVLIMPAEGPRELRVFSPRFISP